MKILELIAHWIFALFVAMISYFISLLLFTFLIAKIAPASDGQSHNMVVFNLAACGTMVVPLMAASFSGIITAPNRQRRIASIAMPILVFLAINAAPYLGDKPSNFSIKWFLLTGGSCAGVGAFFYFRCTQKLLKKTKK
jgi:hypothetical protein